MNPKDRELLAEVRDFLFSHVTIDDKDASARLYTKLALYLERPRPELDRFLAWRKKAEAQGLDFDVSVMVYGGLFPGRMSKLLVELMS